MISPTQFSLGLSKAFAKGNSQAIAFNPNRYRMLRGWKPGTAGPDGQVEDGVIEVGTPQRVEAHRFVEIHPYCMGTPGQPYWMRLVGWRAFGNDPNTWVWKGGTVASFLCYAGAIPGPALYVGQVLPAGADPTPVRLVAEWENFADWVVPVSGSLGRGMNAGDVGGNGRGEGAFVRLPSGGFQLLQVEFARYCRTCRVSMNALWAYSD